MKLFGLCAIEALHQAQCFLHDLARRGVPAGCHLGIDEPCKFVAQRNVDVHERSLSMLYFGADNGIAQAACMTLDVIRGGTAFETLQVNCRDSNGWERP